MHDLKISLRTLSKSPGFVLVAVLSMAIGIGATSVIFSAANALLLRPVAGLPDPGKVVEIGRTQQASGFDTFAYPDFLDLRRDAKALQLVAVWQPAILSLSTGAAGESVAAMLVSADYFQVLGLTPQRGRFFQPREDEGPGTHPLAVVSHRFWQERLEGRPQAVGETILLNRRSFTVVGVAPESFSGHQSVVQFDIWVPMMMQAVLTRSSDTLFENRGALTYLMVGRLAPGATVAQAQASVQTVMQSLAQDFPQTNEHRGARVKPLGPVPAIAREGVAAFLMALMALVGLILLITCANVAGMLLVRAAARSKEIAIRLALGVGRWRLVRLLVIESLLIFALGGLIGFILAWGSTQVLMSIPLPLPVPINLEIQPDWGVFLFSLLIALATGLIFGLLPALQSSKADLVSVLNQQTPSWDRRRRWMRQVFVMGQVGLSLTLLVASGLFLRSLQKAASIETGFESKGVLLTSFDLSREGYGEEDGLLLLDNLQARLNALPGVEATAMAIDLPLDLTSRGTSIFPEGQEAEARGVGVEFNIVTAGYFEALRIPLLQGRYFDDRDRAGSVPSAMVSRTLAERVWPGEDPVGKRFRFDSSGSPWRRVAGVVVDLHNQTLTEETDPFVYLPLAQSYRPDVYVAVRASSRLEGMSDLIRREILAADPSLALAPFLTLEQVTGAGILPQRVAAAVSTSLGIVALLLSGIGLYGVVAFSATRRSREIGIRIALGAQRGHIVRLVMNTGLAVAIPGLAIGLLLAFGVGRLLESFLLGVSPLDPLVLAGVTGIFLLIVLAAGSAPSMRAARIDPAVSLRYE